MSFMEILIILFTGHWLLVFLVSMSLPIWKLKVDGDNNIRFGQENHSALEVYKINK